MPDQANLAAIMAAAKPGAVMKSAPAAADESAGENPMDEKTLLKVEMALKDKGILAEDDNLMDMIGAGPKPAAPSAGPPPGAGKPPIMMGHPAMAAADEPA